MLVQKLGPKCYIYNTENLNKEQCNITVQSTYTYANMFYSRGGIFTLISMTHYAIKAQHLSGGLFNFVLAE